MVHNAVHYAYMLTYSVGRDVHPDEYVELKNYLARFGKFYCLKAEDVDGEGKVHLHAIHIREFEKYDPNPDERKVTQYGARRPDHTAQHVVANCLKIAASITSCGGRHAMKAHPLTSGEYINYLNKETYCHANNLPEDMCMIMPYLSEKTDPSVDPGFAADAKKYAKNVEEGLPWAIDPPNDQSCRRFYRHHMFLAKDKKVMIDENVIKRKAKALRMYMNQSVYSDEEDEPSRKRPREPEEYYCKNVRSCGIDISKYRAMRSGCCSKECEEMYQAYLARQ